MNRHSDNVFEPSAPVFPEAYLPLPTRQTTLRDYWIALTKRRWMIVLFVAAVMILTTVITLKTTPIYDAVGRIAINRESSALFPFKDSSSADEDYYGISMETQVRILRSNSLALRVIRHLGLDRNRAFTASAVPAAIPTEPMANPAAMDPKEESRLLEEFRAGLRLATVANTRIIEIHFMSPDPRLAADIVNSLVTSYIEQNYQTKFESTTQTSDWLSQQLADLRVKVETSQERLVRFQQEKGIVGLDDKQNTTTEKLGDLNKELTAAESDRIQKEANYRLASTGSPDLLGRSTDLLQNLRVREGTLKQEYALLGTQFGSSHPKVRETRNQLDQVQSDITAEVARIAAQIHNEYLTALQRESMVRAELEQQKHEANQLAQNAIEFNILKRDVEANRQLYEGLLQKMKEASIEVGLRSSNVRVVDSARVPLSPSTPDIPRNLGLGLLVGLCGGIGLAFLLETLDNTLYTPEQVEMACGLPVLGVVPLFARPNASSLKPAGLALATADLRDHRFELFALTRPNSEVAESYRALRTSILLSAPEAAPQVILVTSALPQEGKTTTCANVAIVLAQRGMRVLLVDADLRRPGVHKAFGVGCETGLSTLLTGNNTMEEVTIRYPQLPNLCLLPAGPQPPAPAELISSLQMKALLAQWRKDFDHIIIDSPPAVSVTDPVVLSADVDSVILVVRSGKTPKDALQRAEDLLFQVNARVMGVIVNAINVASPGHYYYYHGVNGSDGYHNSEVVSGK